MTVKDDAPEGTVKGQDSPDEEKKGLTAAIFEQLFGKLEEADKRAQDHLAAAASAQAKADNEALRAFQAKTAVEEHSTAVAQMKGHAEADVATIAKYKADLESTAQQVGNSKQTAESDVTAIAGFRRSAEEAANGIAAQQGTASTAVSSIEAFKNDTEKLVQPLRATVKAIDGELVNVTTLRTQADAQAESIKTLSAAAIELRDQAKIATDTISEHQLAAKTAIDSIQEATKKVGETHAAVTVYEQDLSQLKTDFSDIKGKIEALLPGATSASLASSFRVQKEQHEAPRRRWMWVFFGCMVYLTAVSGVALYGHWGGPSESWDAILRLIVQRLPLMIPAIWLAIYAGKQHMLAQRMAEDYANKEAISTAFEGYKREMSNIPGSGGAEAPLLTLCQIVLTTLARRPGRIYEGKVDDVTPFTAVAEGLSRVLTPPAKQS